MEFPIKRMLNWGLNNFALTSVVPKFSQNLSGWGASRLVIECAERNQVIRYIPKTLHY